MRIGQQHNVMSTALGYTSSSHQPVHFGLGAEPRAERIRVTWPDGSSSELRDVEGDRVLRIDALAP